MSPKRRIAWNTLWNWSGLVVAMAAGFVVSPFLVRRLGDSSYGLWLLIASMTGYFGLLDLGMRGSVGRNVAYYRAKGDPRQVGVMFNTALAILAAAGLAALLATFGLLSWFLRLFHDIPPDQVAAARLALLIVGTSLALMLPMNVFDATLWGYQRFDLINAIDIAAVVARTALTFASISRGGGLVALALITLATTQGAGMAKAVAVAWACDGLRFGPGYVTRAGARTLFGFGTWNLVGSISRLLTSQFTTLIIGARMGVSIVTPFSIASRLLGYGASLVSSSAGVLIPVAAGYDAGDEGDSQRRLFLVGGKFCLAFSLFFTTCFLLLGRPLIRAWMGPSQEGTASLLVILALGEALPMGQLITTSIMLGKGRSRLLALIYLADGLAVVAATYFLSAPFGLAGVCAGIAVSGFLIRGLVMVCCGSRLVGVSLAHYVARSVVPAVAAAALPAAALAALVAWRSPRGWAELFLYGGGFTAAYLVGVASLVGFGRLRARLAVMNPRLVEV
jgi:O-antigen/teichoic acid export membrane protein